MEVFAEILAGIDDPQHRARVAEVLAWMMERLSSL